MPAAGTMDRRCAFHRRAAVEDGYGNVAGGWAAVAFLTVWGRLAVERGREVVAAGRAEARRAAALTIRNSADARAVTAADSVVIDGERWAIRSVAVDPAARDVIDLVLEAGGPA